MKFKYFADPVSFSYITSGDKLCNFCSTKDHCIDGSHLYGENDIEAVCFGCMKSGELIALDISANEIDLSGLKNDAEKISNQIIYCTPPLPTWQDSTWPLKHGKPCEFIKIASKIDYVSEQEFKDSLAEDTNQDLWEMLPNKKISNLKEGQYDVSFYLFAHESGKLTLWDAN